MSLDTMLEAVSVMMGEEFASALDDGIADACFDSWNGPAPVWAHDK